MAPPSIQARRPRGRNPGDAGRSDPSRSRSAGTVGSATISVDELQPGMFVHLDLDWWAHPFALSSFVIDSPAQIETIRTLGLRRLRWCPERSRQPCAPDEEADAATAPPP